MKYLKEFSTESEYLTYRDGADYLKPNVSLLDDKGEVYYNFTPPIVYEAVDLGLPSGTKWAAQNVGARKPSDAGLYFQWGDISGYSANQVGTGDGKKKFSSDWSDYKWNPSGDGETFTKYTTPGATLELEDDAAHANMGGDWHMPTFKQFKELTANTTISWTTLNGVSGNTFTSKKDGTKSIFIPAAGNAWGGEIVVSDYSYFWFPELSYRQVSGGQYFYFTPNSIGSYSDYIPRSRGYSIRGVIG